MRALWIGMKIYAGLCTLLITAYLCLGLWQCFFPAPPGEAAKANLEYSYNQYLTNGAPRRDNYFLGLAMALVSYSKEVPVLTTNVFKYLGKPDLISGTVESGELAYFYKYSGITNQYTLYVSIICSARTNSQASFTPHWRALLESSLVFEHGGVALESGAVTDGFTFAFAGV
jgi:hypothetical protein